MAGGLVAGISSSSSTMIVSAAARVGWIDLDVDGMAGARLRGETSPGKYFDSLCCSGLPSF